MGRTDILPVCIKAGALGGNAPRRDLWISPLHAMYFERSYFDRKTARGAGECDGVLIEAKDLINGCSIVQTEQVDRLEYFHIELDSHDVIFAEGVLSETFIDDDSRGMFHNADEFHALYPQPRTALAQYCAPRLCEGFEVAAVRRHIAMRAGLLPSAEPRRDVTLRGQIDETGPRGIKGWAQNSEAPEVPICLDIYADDHLLGQTLANLYRADLAAAGLGSGRHAFSFALPAGFILGGASIEVRRSLDGARLAGASRASRHSRLKAAM
jgi:hypothetical protein